MCTVHHIAYACGHQTRSHLSRCPSSLLGHPPKACKEVQNVVQEVSELCQQYCPGAYRLDKEKGLEASDAAERLKDDEELAIELEELEAMGLLF